MENEALRRELDEARQKLLEYRSMLQQARTIHEATSSGSFPASSRADAFYRTQSVKCRESVVEERLQKLTLLREGGTLTEEEFQEKRAELLASDRMISQ